MSIDYQHTRSAPLQMRLAGGRMSADHRLRLGFPRPKPYSKPTPSQPSTGNVEGKWAHDLFDVDSNLYGPKLNQQIARHIASEGISTQPSPSLRPFGSSSASSTASSAASPARLLAPSGLLASLTTQTQPSVSMSQPRHACRPLTSSTLATNPGTSLLSRIQPSPSQSLLYPPQTTLRSTIAPSKRAVSTAPSQSNLNVQRGSQDFKHRNVSAHRAFDEAMAKYLSGPVILEVANLADGTSAEDVKTAFADFGEIQECSTEEGPRQANQPTLKARMVFTHKSEAEKAVEALNGALADGLTLAVKIVGRPTRKPEKSEFMPAIVQSGAPLNQASSDVTMKDANEDAAMQGSSGFSPAAIVPTGRLRSDIIAECDPRATLLSDPQPLPIYQTTEPVATNFTIMKRVHQSTSNLSRRQHTIRSNLNVPAVANKTQSHSRQTQVGSSLSLLARIGRT